MTEPAFAIAPTILATLQPPIAAAYAWARPFVAQHPEKLLLDMAQGAPGGPPPHALLDALSDVARHPTYTYRYGLNGGEEVLRSALASEIRRIYAVPGREPDVKTEDIAITSGCNLAFFATMVCIAQRGDEVILPVPWYFNHHMALTMLGITPVELPALPLNGFVPQPDAAERLVTDRTRAIVLVTPNNPTGAVYPPEILAGFLDLARRRKLALIVDETYRDFLPMSTVPHELFNSSWRDTLVHLFSFSKSYALPGTRLGAVVASPSLLAYIHTALDTIQICPPRAPQIALAPLLPTMRPFITAVADALRDRHDAFRRAMPTGWTIGASGAYFAFIRHPFDGIDAETVCSFLAREYGVVMLPATFFGYNNDGKAWIRASVASVPPDRMPELRMALEAANRHFT